MVPAVLLGLAMSAVTMRLVRTTMLDVLGQDYVRTARAKGLGETAVVVRHALRNGMIPVITLIGLQAPILIGGAVIFEQIFVIPGMGLLLLEAVFTQGLPGDLRCLPGGRRLGAGDQPAGRPELRSARPEGATEMSLSPAGGCP